MEGVSLIPAEFTSPSGVRISFKFKEVAMSVDKTIATADYALMDGGDAIDLGHGLVSYPLVCLFSGRTFQHDSDRAVRAFMERGVGILQHPVWGLKHVIARGISVAQDYVEQVGASSVTVLFLEVGNIKPLQAVTGDKQAVIQANKSLLDLFLDILKQARLSASHYAKFTSAIMKPLQVVNELLKFGWQLAGTWQATFGQLETAINGVLAAPSAVVAILDAFVYPIKKLSDREQFEYIQSLSDAIYVDVFDSGVIHVRIDHASERAVVDAAFFCRSLLTMIACEVAFGVNESLPSRDSGVSLLLNVQELEKNYGEACEKLYGTIGVDSAALNVSTLALMEQNFATLKEAILSRLAGLKTKISYTILHNMSVNEAIYLMIGRVPSDAEYVEFITLNDLADDEILLLPPEKEVYFYG